MARVTLGEDPRGLDRPVQVRALKAAKKLEQNPEQRGQPLGSRSGRNLTTFRKLVVGDRDYRIIYRVESDGSVLVVWIIGCRADEEASELAMARLRIHDSTALRELAISLEEIWQARP
jgi:mRNA interferase RelE/StbE